jgi:hypothetical protein
VTTNAHQVILAAAAAALAVSPAVADVITHSGSPGRPSLPEGQAQQVDIRFAGSDPDRGDINGAPIDWITHIRIDALARGTATVGAEFRALQLHADAWHRLMTDATFRALVQDLQPGQIQAPDAAEGDATCCCISGFLMAVHRTSANTLEI